MSETQLILLIYVLVAFRAAVHLRPRILARARTRRVVNEYLDSFIVAGCAALLLITFVVRSFYIPSGSMLPTLQIRDYILVNKFIYHFCKPSRGDILVFHPPDSEMRDPSKREFIKRVVAIEGDTVEVREGILYVNGLKQEEPYLFRSPFSDEAAEIRVPPGHIFMMGDNRDNSDDSRSWGTLPLDRVVGKAFVIFFPPTRIRLL